MALNLDGASVAAKAAELLRERGLARAELLGPDGSVCFNGAILIAMLNDSAPLPDSVNCGRLWTLVREQDPSLVGAPFGTGLPRLTRTSESGAILQRISAIAADLSGMIRHPGAANEQMVHWNNDPERTADEVADLLSLVSTEYDTWTAHVDSALAVANGR